MPPLLINLDSSIVFTEYVSFQDNYVRPHDRGFLCVAGGEGQVGVVVQPWLVWNGTLEETSAEMGCS